MFQITSRSRVVMGLLAIAVGVCMVACGYNDTTGRFTMNGQDVDPQVVSDTVGGGVNIVAPGIGTIVSGALLAVWGTAASIVGAIRKSKLNKAKGTIAQITPYADAAVDLVQAIDRFKRDHPDAWPTLRDFLAKSASEGGTRTSTDNVVNVIQGRPVTDPAVVVVEPDGPNA